MVDISYFELPLRHVYVTLNSVYNVISINIGHLRKKKYDYILGLGASDWGLCLRTKISVEGPRYEL